MGETRQYLAGLVQDAWQPCLATEADVPTNTKTRKRTEAAAADRAKRIGDCFSAKKVDIGPTSLISFGIKAKLPALPLRDDAPVDKSAAVLKPCLSRVKMRTPTASGGLLLAGTVSTAMRTIFPRPFSWLGASVKRLREKQAGQT